MNKSKLAAVVCSTLMALSIVSVPLTTAGAATAEAAAPEYGAALQEAQPITQEEQTKAEAPFFYSVKEDGTLSITGYGGSETELVIPAEIDGARVTEIYASAFAGSTSLESVVVPSGVSTIYAYAFKDCTSLKSVQIPDGTVTIGNSVFMGCTSIESLKIPDSVTSMGLGVFYGCTSLKSVKLSENITDIGMNAFYGCSALEQIEIPEGVALISTQAFEGATSIKSISLPKSVEMVEPFAFKGCTSLSDITIPEGVKYIAPSAFEGCSALTIHGALGSYAESFARENSIKFADDSVTEPQSVSLDKDAVILGLNETIQLSAQSSPSHINTDFTWSSSNKNVAAVSASGKVTAKKTGTANITVKTSNGKTAVCKISVKAAPSSVALSQTSITVGVGEQYVISENTNKGSYANADNLIWTSSNAKVASVEKLGGNRAKITAKAAGTATVKIKLYNGKTASCLVTVKAAPKSVKLNKADFKLGCGESTTIMEYTNSGSYANASNLKWTSSDSSVAQVTKLSNNRAKITAKGVGTAVISIELYNGLRSECTVTVRQAPSKVELSQSEVILGKGEKYTILEYTNSGSYASSESLKWSSSNTRVATITKLSSNRARITAKSNGTATVTVKTYNGKTANCKVTVKNAPSSVVMSQTNTTLGVGESLAISEKTNSGTYANAENLKWSSSNSKVAVVEKLSKNRAKVTAKGVGTATITVKTFNGKTASCKVTVKAAPTAVKLNRTGLNLGITESYTLSEYTNSGSYANSSNLKWSSSDKSVAEVVKLSNNQAKVVAKKTGTAVITLKLYNGLTAKCKVNVKVKVYLSPSRQKANTYAAGNTNEMEQCDLIAAATEKALERCGFNVKLGKSGDTMQNRCKESDSFKADVHMPIHTNAMNGRYTGGTRVFYKTSAEKKISQSVLDELGKISPGKDDRVAYEDELYEINVPKAASVYVECEFHDTKQGAQWIIGNTEEIAEAICKGLCDYYNISYVSP